MRSLQLFNAGNTVSQRRCIAYGAAAVPGVALSFPNIRPRKIVCLPARTDLGLMAPAGLPMAANFNPTLFNGGISVTINANGAELVSLKNRAGLELLWPGRAGLATPRADTVSDRRPAQE